MRIPLFARGSNPAIDLPIQRKSESYGASEVDAGRADWVDPDDHAKGIVCRAFLYRGEVLKPARPEQITVLARRNSLPPIEIGPGPTRFDDPRKGEFLRQDRYDLLVRAEAFARFGDIELRAQAQA